MLSTERTKFRSMEPATSSPLPRDTSEQDPALAQSEDQSQGRLRVSAYDLMVVDSDLEGLDQRKEEMRNIFDDIQDKASLILQFSLKWEEIDDRFGFLKQRAMEKEVSVRNQILELEKKEERLRLVEERERKIEASFSTLQEKGNESDLILLMEANVMRLVLQMQFEQVVVAQLNAQENFLGSLHDSMMKKHEELMTELEARKNEVALISKTIDAKTCDLDMKVKDFDLKQTTESERMRKETELMETSLKQLEARENELRLLNETIQGKSMELEKKEVNFQLKHEAAARETEVKNKFLELKEKKLEEREQHLELKQRKKEKPAIRAETRKRSRLEYESPLSAEKGRYAETLIRPGKKQVQKREAHEIIYIDEDEPFNCPDPDFHDFNNTMSSFAVGQVWALYDPVDDMPRYYAEIRKVLQPQLSLRVTWLESLQTTEEPIPACGRFEHGKSETSSHLMFSHEMYHTIRGQYVTINPRKGETWALFGDWTKTWKSHSEQQKTPYSYDFVEVVTEFDSDRGIGVAYLGRVEGFTSVYERAVQNGLVEIMISCDEMLRFSHRVPSFKMTGDVIEGVRAGSFELDPAAVPRVYLKDAKVKEEKMEPIVLV
ncbi:unnamed protein product [Arabidopsis thaliana]|nr:unnamed protein product [Arabidopsis thaliana]